MVDGKPVKRIDSRCGYVPQKYSLFPDRTVLGNVMYGPENARSRHAGPLAAVVLSLSTRAARRGHELSRTHGAARRRT